MSSASSSLRSSPYGSNSDLNDEEIYNERPVRKSRSKRGGGGGGYDYDEVEQTIHKAQQDAGEFTQDYNKFRAETQNHAKRIKDLIVLAQESRLRIDALLGRRTRARSYDDDSYRAPTTIKRPSVDYDNDDRNNRRESRDNDEWRSSRDVDRDRSYAGSDRDRDRYESRDLDRNRSYGKSDRESNVSEHREQTGQIITCNSPNVVEVGGVSLNTKEIELNKNKTITVEASGGTVNIATKSPMSPPPPPVAKKPPKKSPAADPNATATATPALTKSPFKFGTVSLQVKLED